MKIFFILERKLNRLQKKGQPVKRRDIVDQLQTSRNDHLENFINGEGSYCEADESLTSNLLTRKLKPEQQALCLEEIQELVKSDQLQKEYQEQHNFDNSDEENNRTSR